MESEILVREWKSDELAAVRDVMWRTWLDAYSSFIPVADMRKYLDLVYSDESFSGMFSNPEIRGWVAEEKGRIVGCARTRFARDEQRFYLSSLYIVPGHQGKGIGVSLMRRGAEDAAARGLDKLWIGVMVQNTAGLAWYHRYGYSVVEELPFVMGNTSVPHVIGYILLSHLLEKE